MYININKNKYLVRKHETGSATQYVQLSGINSKKGGNKIIVPMVRLGRTIQQYCIYGGLLQINNKTVSLEEENPQYRIYGKEVLVQYNNIVLYISMRTDSAKFECDTAIPATKTIAI